MSRSAYSRIACHLCGQPVSTAGFAQYNHKMKHVREGRMKRKRVSFGGIAIGMYWEFEIVAKEAADGE